MSFQTKESSPNPSNEIDWWNRTRYQLYAPIYDWVSRPMEQGRKQAIERLHPEEGDRILILGSGTGSDFKYLPTGASITALDAAPAMVKQTAARANSLGHEADVQVGNAQALPFEDDTFDAVLLHLILTVVPNPQVVAAETARVLTPNGRVSIFDKFVPSGTKPSLLRRALNPVARFLFSELTRQLDPILTGTGLEVSRRETTLGGLYTVAIARPSTEQGREQ